MALKKILNYTVGADDLFEPIIKEDNFEYNHVVIKPQFFFPTHPTDANVIITVIRGELWLTLEEEEQQVYKEGAVVLVDQGTVSTLGNGSDAPSEVFVIKRR